MDSVSTLLHHKSTLKEQGKDESSPLGPSENEEMKRKQADTSGIQDDWSWETPDLSEDGDWYKAQVRSLKAVVAELPSMPNLLKDVLSSESRIRVTV
jgi:hypothetical protein